MVKGDERPPAGNDNHGRQRSVSTPRSRKVELERARARWAGKHCWMKYFGQRLDSINESRPRPAEQSARIYGPRSPMREPRPFLLLRLHRSLGCGPLRIVAAGRDD